MMRWLLVALLVANFVIFLWGFTMVKRQPVPFERDTVSPDVETIVLLKEIESEKPQEAIVALPPEVSEPDLVVPVKGDFVHEPVTEKRLSKESSVLASDAEMAIEDADSVVPTEYDLDGIVDERRSVEPEQADVEVINEDGVPGPVVVCGRIGPFDAELPAEKLGAQLNLSEAEIVSETETVNQADWVLIPALPSREEGQKVAEKLREAGFDDLWLFNDGPLKNAISLGMFNRIENAENHSKTINEQGFNSEVRPKVAKQTKFWLRYRDDDETLASFALPPEVINTKKSCDGVP